MARDDKLSIQPAGIDQAEEALRLAFRSLSAEQRTRQVELIEADLRAARLSRDTLLEARRGNRRVGAVHWQVYAGRSATIWPPGTVAGEPPATADLLMQTALERIAAEPVRIVQVLLERVSQRDAAFLNAHGFAYLANLLYLVCLEIEFPRQRPAGPLQFEEFRLANHDRLAQVVEATYEQTCDCPSLDNCRDINDVLAGYRASGEFDPTRWLIVRHEDRDVGCLLLADHPDEGNVELLYMGLVSPARGNGWGKHIVRHAQWLTRLAGRPRLVLAVDAANAPALQVYATCGFQAWDRRAAFLKVLDEAR